ncbi:hypothetical protein SK128_003582 [Halocaridina rubra]|uniref:Uncharacterized protein n=1 Tax=Halocaridina rubra TaxID=373956 RepID=A0AAN9A8K4_HALRR
MVGLTQTVWGWGFKGGCLSVCPMVDSTLGMWLGNLSWMPFLVPHSGLDTYSVWSGYQGWMPLGGLNYKLLTLVLSALTTQIMWFQRKLSDKLDQCVLKWFGHMERMNDDLLAVSVWRAEVNGMSLKGSSRMRCPR